MSILDKFTVVDLVKTRSNSVATVSNNILKFNNQTAAEMRYAPYIQILVSPKDHQFAIRACKEGDPNALAFSKPEGEQKYQIKLSCAAATDIIRKMANWPIEETWNIPGLYFAEENVLIYDVRTATRPNPARNGWAIRRERMAAEAEAEAAGAIVAEDGEAVTEES